VASTNQAWDDPLLRRQVESKLQGFLSEHADLLTTIAPDTDLVSHSLTDFLHGGKRMRGVLCYWGWRAAGGELNDHIVTAAAAMEFLQACALIHDDVMDGSDMRRGLPAIHRRFATEHESNGWSGSADRFGQAAAILLGDLCLAWADELLFSPAWEPAQARRGKLVYDLMRTELMVGQYLDVLGQARATDDVAAALRVATFKSGKYSVERPLQLGASLAADNPTLASTLGEYGSSLGQAFQLRDDLLGVFGEPAATGKPAGDDLREGKRTVLIALTKQACDASAATVLEAGLGNPDLDRQQIDQLRQLILDSRANERVEELIEELLLRSLASLDQAEMPEDVKLVLASLAASMAHRNA
jgi:geranylgeranyl diphosphate synthase type I